jgi:hypothetical protein
MKTSRVAPSAANLSESVRDIGYSLGSALADIVDNSISAGASKVEIFADTSGSKIGILDNGSGLTRDELIEAMRLGTRNPLVRREGDDLGRFGIGLKTASFSQCRRLTVATRKGGASCCAVWDLDFIAEKDDWLLQLPENAAHVPWVDRLGSSGTLVVWESLDRLVDSEDPESSRGQFISKLDEARQHLELVFHRFLAGEQRSPKFQIKLNERPLTAFDPFNSKHVATITGPVENIKLGKHIVAVQCFTLPHHQKCSAEEWEKWEGNGGYLKNQGFYVYRARRLIIHGTWFGLARQMELTKLARIRIDISNDLDTEWKIDVKKASAQLPHQVRERLRRIIEPLSGASKRTYTSRGRKLVTDNRLPVWNRIQDKNAIVYRLNQDHPVMSEFLSKLPQELRSDFRNLLQLTETALPMDALFADMGETPEKVGGNPASDQMLQHAIDATVRTLSKSGLTKDEIIEMLEHAPPFRSDWKRTMVLLKNAPWMEKTRERQPSES